MNTLFPKKKMTVLFIACIFYLANVVDLQQLCERANDLEKSYNDTENVYDIPHVCEAENKYPWSYHGTENDPSHWSELYESCGEPSQAPIPIFDEKEVPGYPELKFKGFERPIIQAKVENLGWTVQITPEDNYKRSLKFGYAEYELQSIQFHFGSESDPGAENVVNDIRYPMEIHYQMIQRDPFIIGVLCTLMDVDDEENIAFYPITEALPSVTYRGDVADMEEYLFLSFLLPEMTGGAYAYYSHCRHNNVPPCEDKHVWWILKDVGKISRDQLDVFLKLYSVGEDDASDECKMGPNYRPLQGGRNQSVFTGQYHVTAGSDY